jgi:hypothetical protein
LTLAGWNQASPLFTHPVPQPTKFKIVVTSKDYSVWEPNMKGPTSALVIVGVAGDIWSIGPELQITNLSTGYFKSGLSFKLIQTDKHWDLQSDGTMKR